MSVIFKKSVLEQIIISQIGLKCLRFHDIIPQLNPTLLYQDLKKLGFVDAFRIQQLKLQFQVQLDDEKQNKIQNKTIIKVDLEQIQSHLCLDILLCLLNCQQTTSNCFWVQDKEKQNDDQGDILLVDKDNKNNVEEFNNLNINENNEDDDILLIDSIDDLIQNKDTSHFEKFIKQFDIEKFVNFHSQQLQKVINKNDLRQSNMQKSFQDSCSELSNISQGNMENTSDKIIKIILNIQNIEIKISENHAFQFQDSSNKLIELDLDDVEQRCDDNVSQNRYQEDQYNDQVQKDMNFKQNDQIQIEMNYFNPKDMQQQIYLEKKQKEQKKKNQQKRVVYKNNENGQIYSIKLERLGLLFTDYSGCQQNCKSDQNIQMSNDSKASDQYDSDDFTRVSIYLESLKILQEENKNIRQILSQKQKGNFMMVLDILQLKNKNNQTVHELNIAIDDIDVCINKALINFLKNLSSKDILKTINQNLSKQTKLNDQFPNFNVSTIKIDEQDIRKQENLFNDKLNKRHNKQNISSQTTDSLLMLYQDSSKDYRALVKHYQKKDKICFKVYLECFLQ
ncbi:hypothetical protein PPERSA_05838 [Pseudocohnilembus persalinus]|uniref:Uncharacterized protein n=1 Tax=Pseudocohnilembus persalinus TaxID=266149 RepID=A0A0V0R3W7_PSEPJ|nr:hypothetical protein PPERSA_05838 [Pseudocohnilembus persalinus]|eukprot:KRX09169.1 hypothetical protein PPERSA_05838 [Pseudocohnilembus persalinus]